MSLRSGGAPRAGVAFSCLALCTITACGGEGSDLAGPTDSTGTPVTPPTMAEVAGDYSATEFTGGGYDVLALEGSLDITLGADGSLSGSMHVPEAAGGPLTADMAGTYTLSGTTLTFTQSADTFVRDATWTWKGDGVIEGSWSGAGGSASVKLER